MLPAGMGGLLEASCGRKQQLETQGLGDTVEEGTVHMQLTACLGGSRASSESWAPSHSQPQPLAPGSPPDVTSALVSELCGFSDLSCAAEATRGEKFSPTATWLLCRGDGSLEAARPADST